MRWIIFTFLMLSCGPKKEVPSPMTIDPEAPHQVRYDEVVARLPDFLDKGFIVSKKDGESHGLGDSLLFSGLALYALDCKAGQPIADAFLKMLKDLDGGVYRHPDIPDKEPSLDGLLGMYRGIIKRIGCDGIAPWAEAMKNHRARMAASLPPEFNLISDTLAFKLGLAGIPDQRRVKTLALEVSTWAFLVKQSKTACYRVHLGLIALQAMDDMGMGPDEQSRGHFAEASSGLDMPTVDHYSGRPGLKDWLDNFEYDVWQYYFQRCPRWESPDGQGLNHPALDFLVGYADLYGAPK